MLVNLHGAFGYRQINDWAKQLTVQAQDLTRQLAVLLYEKNRQRECSTSDQHRGWYNWAAAARHSGNMWQWLGNWSESTLPVMKGIWSTIGLPCWWSQPTCPCEIDSCCIVFLKESDGLLGGDFNGSGCVDSYMTGMKAGNGVCLGSL